MLKCCLWDLIVSIADMKLYLQSSILLGLRLIVHYIPKLFFTTKHIRTPFLYKSLKRSWFWSYSWNYSRYLRTLICIWRLMEGSTGLLYFFLLEPTESLRRDLDKELLWNDLFFWGVYIFLNLQRYISLYPPLSVLKMFSSFGYSFWTRP